MLIITTIIIILFILVVYVYFKRLYFTLHGPLSGIPPQFLFGNLLQTGVIGRGEPLPNILRQLQDKFGDVYQYWLGHTRIVVVSRLEDVQYIFAHRHKYEQGEIFADKISLIAPNSIVCLTGANYKRHASLTIPLLRRVKFLSHLSTINDCANKLLTRWEKINDPTYIHLDMFNQLQQLLLDLFGFIFFDYDLQILDNRTINGNNELAQAFHTVLTTAMSAIQLPKIAIHIFLFFNLKYRRSHRLVNQYLTRMIEQELEETPQGRFERKKTSLIASLVASLQDDEKVEATKTDDDDKKGLSRAEVLDEMLTFLMAGSGSTAAAVTWFIYLMSVHPEIQEKVKKELFQFNQQSLSIAQLDSLIYLECVLREMFRFVPPAIGTMRTLLIDDRLPSTGAELKKGDLIFIPISNLGRDSRYWLGPIGPDQFYPERFLNEENEIHNNKSAFIPFGGGHRQCIGQDLARLMVKTICARFMQHVTFGDGGPQVNSGGYSGDGGDSIIPKHMGVTIKFDINDDK